MKSVRAQCVERDGDCRFCEWERHPHDTHSDSLEACYGEACGDDVPEWAHLGRMKRARTRGMTPELRHTTGGSLMLCRFHHRLYDSGKIAIDVVDDAGADGRLAFEDNR